MVWATRLAAPVGVALLCAVVLVAASGCSSSDRSGASTTTTTDPAFATGRHRTTFVVDGRKRTAIVVVPRRTAAPAPLVLAFHGHGGTGAGLERQLDIAKRWPEAVIVYPDGLTGHRGITDPAGDKTGWQTATGEAGDRDLAFFDEIVTTLRSKVPIDDERIYLVGHSNGSQLVSLLLNQRGDEIAATANLSAAPGPGLIATDPVRSMLVSLGRSDPIVPFDRQELLIPLIERHLGVDPAKAVVDGYRRTEPGPSNIELETYIHPGGHPPPPGITGVIVDFFRRHTLSGG
jgi:polyhydroxybutyrate depolymerase